MIDVAAGCPPATPPGAVPTVAWVPDGQTPLPGRLEFLDQTRLPHEAVAVACRTVGEARQSICRLAVRGAPALGVAGAWGLLLGVQHLADASPAEFHAALADTAEALGTSRPTAVNLGWAIRRCLSAVAGTEAPAAALEILLAEAAAIHREDEEACLAMGRHGAALLREGGSYLTHCNTGRLATAGIGTALGVFFVAHSLGMGVTVYVPEVRPLLQGARLTTFELLERGIDGVLLPDSAAGSLLRSGRIEAVFVGADRIAANGDTANKIGTYPLAELARANGVAFHVVAPTSTIDPTLWDGSAIPIEQRAADEVTGMGGHPVAPEGFPVLNPAFDVTPAHLISAIVTETGVIRPPFRFRTGALG